jgi:hypothetical protein
MFGRYLGTERLDAFFFQTQGKLAILMPETTSVRSSRAECHVRNRVEAVYIEPWASFQVPDYMPWHNWCCRANR